MGWMGLWANGVSFLSETLGSESVSIGATGCGDGCGDPGWPRQCRQRKHRAEARSFTGNSSKSDHLIKSCMKNSR